MKKYTLPALIILLPIAIAAYAAWPTHANTGQSDMNAINGNWDSFRWTWTSGETESNVLSITQGTTGYNMGDATGIGFRMAYLTSTGGFVVAYSTTNITVSTSNLVWVLSYTNNFAPGTYRAEVFAWYGASSNEIRTLGQGRVRVLENTF